MPEAQAAEDPVGSLAEVTPGVGVNGETGTFFVAEVLNWSSSTRPKGETGASVIVLAVPLVPDVFSGQSGGCVVDVDDVGILLNQICRGVKMGESGKKRGGFILY